MTVLPACSGGAFLAEYNFKYLTVENSTFEDNTAAPIGGECPPRAWGSGGCRAGHMVKRLIILASLFDVA